MLEPLQRILEARLALYSRQHIGPPDNLRFIPMLMGAGAFAARRFPPLANEIIHFLEYLIDDRFTVSQLAGYQGEMAFLLPFRSLRSSVFNITVDTSLSVSEKIFFQYFQSWQQQAPTLNMVHRIQQTGSLSYVPPFAGVNEMHTENLEPRSWQMQPEISPLNYLYRKSLARNLSVVYNTLRQFEYLRLNTNVIGRDIDTSRMKTQWAGYNPLDTGFVFAAVAAPSVRSHEISGAYEKGSGDLPSTALNSLRGYDYSGRHGSITLTGNPEQLAEYIGNRISTAFTSLLRTSHTPHSLPVSWNYLTSHPVIGPREDTESPSMDRSPDAAIPSLKRTGFLRRRSPDFSASKPADYSLRVVRPRAAGPHGDVPQPAVPRGEHPEMVSLWPKMILNLQGWLNLMEKSQEISLTERPEGHFPKLPPGLHSLNRREAKESSGGNRSVAPAKASDVYRRRRTMTQQDAEEFVLRDFTFIRAAEQVRQPHQNYTFARVVSPHAKEKPASQEMQQKEVVRLVRKEVETALKAQSPMENLTRVEVTRLADQVYSTLVRRLVIEKERLSG